MDFHLPVLSLISVPTFVHSFVSVFLDGSNIYSVIYCLCVSRFKMKLPFLCDSFFMATFPGTASCINFAFRIVLQFHVLQICPSFSHPAFSGNFISFHIYLLRKTRHRPNQIDIEQLSRTTKLTRTALTVALNN